MVLANDVRFIIMIIIVKEAYWMCVAKEFQLTAIAGKTVQICIQFYCVQCELCMYINIPSIVLNY